MKRRGRPRKATPGVSERCVLIAGTIIWTEACVACPKDMGNDAIPEWVGQRFMAHMDLPPARLTSGTLEEVQKALPGHSIPALKMFWQRYKRGEEERRRLGLPSLLQLPWR